MSDANNENLKVTCNGETVETLQECETESINQRKKQKAKSELSAERKLKLISEDLSMLINSLKEQVVTDRRNHVKDKMEENKKKLMSMTNHFFNISNSMKSSLTSCTIMHLDLLSQRKERILCTLRDADLTGREKMNSSYIEESVVSSSVLLGNSVGGKSVFRPIKLQEVPKLPPYTTWIFLDRNQRMTEDQSVVGRRRIYYDQNCGEALICSDSEEEVIEDEEDKKDFGFGEDCVIWKTIEEVGLSEAVLDYLSFHFQRKSCDIKARYENLLKTDKIDEYIKKGGREAVATIEDSLTEKDLDAALDSFDNLFCRRCLVFDCRLHGCSQDLVFPAEKQNPWSNCDLDIACSSQCYRLQALKSECVAADPPICSVSELRANSLGSNGVPLSLGKKTPGSLSGRNTCQSESASNAKIISESSESEVSPHQDGISPDSSLSPSTAKIEEKSCLRKRNSKRVAERVLVNIQKKRKGMALSDSDSFISGPHCPIDVRPRSSSCHLDKDASFSSQKRKSKSPMKKKSRKKESPALDKHNSSQVKPNADNFFCSRGATKGPLITGFVESLRKEEFVDENTCKAEAMEDIYWKTIEKSLFAKGLEIFGKNSCLIARNLMNGMKTCSEVFRYMNFIDNNAACNNGDAMNSQIEGHNKGSEFRRRSRFLRRRGRVRRLKYTWKSAGSHSIRKRISERKDQPCRQYNPCGCQFACGKQCSCLLNGTCCEKYCGCPKMCKNRFRGCHCAKSQCRSRQCPCFAANRECDPDVCRNCWVGCGDGSLGGPAQRGDNYECRNMKLFLKQQQRVLLGRSDVSGWGAFLKNSVAKHEYLGEYTGELISHREADKRGKIYDRENSSFLFNLNDQFVLDAYRKGDKLKFANHSPDPNCYAKVIMVAGDHRVGIFAKERINAGEELFYDYRYEPDRAPAWARKPETSALKKDEAPSNGRAKKLA